MTRRRGQDPAFMRCWYTALNTGKELRIPCEDARGASALRARLNHARASARQLDSNYDHSLEELKAVERQINNQWYVVIGSTMMGLITGTPVDAEGNPVELVPARPVAVTATPLLDALDMRHIIAANKQQRLQATPAAKPAKPVEELPPETIVSLELLVADDYFRSQLKQRINFRQPSTGKPHFPIEHAIKFAAQQAAKQLGGVAPPIAVTDLPQDLQDLIAARQAEFPVEPTE